MTVPEKLFTHTWLDINVYMFAKRNTKDGVLGVSQQRIADEFGTTRDKVRHILDKLYDEELLVRPTFAQLSPSISSTAQQVTTPLRPTSAQLPPKVESLEDRKKLFITRLQPYLDKYGRDMLNDFYQYWAQVNENGKKMLWEMQKAFEIPNRLAAWYSRNNQRYNTSYERKQQEQLQRLETYADVAASFRRQQQDACLGSGGGQG